MSEREPYADRRHAGRTLADELAAYRARDDVLVLGLPRGGVPVAAEVAAALDAPLDVLVVRKLGLPVQPELAMGAIAAVGEEVEVVRNEDVLHEAGVPEDVFARVYHTELAELRARQRAYRGARPTPELTGRTVIVVDDGLATGSTMRAALAALRRFRTRALVAAVPVGAAAACAAVARSADEVVCPWEPEPLYAVGQAYRRFPATTDAEVRACLAAAPRDGATRGGPGAEGVHP